MTFISLKFSLFLNLEKFVLHGHVFGNVMAMWPYVGIY